VVQKARRAAAETSGATSGARVAAYLRGGAEERPPAEKILERLTSPQAAQPKPAAPVATVPKVDDKKLEALTKAAESTPSAGKPKPAAEEKPVDLSKADEKLSSLLGKLK
jgi:hypothetical protein